MSGVVRIGVLGAARIAPAAVIEPAAAHPRAQVVAIAARDPQRAREFATRHGIAEVDASYEALLERPDIDAVYIPTPNGLHGRWTVAALEAGKHVLCEKPFAANAAEADAVRAVARRHPNLVVSISQPYLYSTLLSPSLSSLSHISTLLCFISSLSSLSHICILLYCILSLIS